MERVGIILVGLQTVLYHNCIFARKRMRRCVPVVSVCRVLRCDRRSTMGAGRSRGPPGT